LQLSFAVDILLTIPAAVAILLIPETVGDRRWQWRPQRIIVPAAVRPVFIPAAIAGLSGFAVFGVFSSVVPSFISRVLHLSNHALVGAILFLLLIFSVLGQIAVNRLNVRVALPLGCAGLMLGTGLVGLAVLLSQLWPLITATVVLGSGQGLVVGSGLGGINQKAPEKQRGEVASTYFTALYFGLTLPVVATGFASDSLGLRPAGLLMTSSTIVVVGAVLAWLLLRPVATD
jgi:MFS family permease